MAVELARSAAPPRWELYALLADPTRLRLLALCAVEELAVGEIAELLRELQPKVSRHAAALRDAGLLLARRQGTWTLLRLRPEATADAVVADALAAGRAMVERDGVLARVAEVVATRDAATREHFERAQRPLRPGPPSELCAYLAALAPLVSPRALAVDAGTGDGALLEVLAPVFAQVIACDRSEAQLALARERAKQRGFGNVRFVRGEIDGSELRAAVRKRDAAGADAIFAARVLHHAPVPARALAALAALVRPGGAVLVLDYESHRDEELRAEQADLWLGFEAGELAAMAARAGLDELTQQRLPAAWCGDGPDRRLGWQVLSGRRPCKRGKP